MLPDISVAAFMEISKILRISTILEILHNQQRRLHVAGVRDILVEAVQDSQQRQF